MTSPLALEIGTLLGLIGGALFLLRKPGAFAWTLFRRWFPPEPRRAVKIHALIGLLAFSLCAVTSIWVGIPEPAVHDEFSNLLLADTLAQGRLANPPHPHWKHFETFHVIQQPTYASKYPPAQGVALAIGQRFFGYPIVGVWLSVALACAAISWMLAGWCPLRWAAFGGLLAVGRLVFSYWSHSYWGGAVPALGGAWVLGALPRILKYRRRRDALAMAGGLILLANSRPWEGFWIALAVLAALILGIRQTAKRAGPFPFRRLAVPSLALLLGAGGAMLYYNFRITGHPFQMPYQVHESTYGVAPVFLWQPLKPAPAYRHAALEEFHTQLSVNSYRAQQTFAGWLRKAGQKLKSLGLFFGGLWFLPFLVAWPWMWRRRKVRFALGTGLLLLGVLLAETWTFPHYAAPFTAGAIFLMVESFRQTRLARWRGRPLGAALVRAALPCAWIAALLSFALIQRPAPSGWHRERAHLVTALEATADRHLILVRYGHGHSPQEEWVYNRADIDNARVVWARTMNPDEDRKLLDFFKDRRAWLLTVEPAGLNLSPYPF